MSGVRRLVPADAVCFCLPNDLDMLESAGNIDEESKI